MREPKNPLSVRKSRTIARGGGAYRGGVAGTGGGGVFPKMSRPQALPAGGTSWRNKMSPPAGRACGRDMLALVGSGGALSGPPVRTRYAVGN